MNTEPQREGILQRSALQISTFMELPFYSLSVLVSVSEIHQRIDTLRSILQKKQRERQSLLWKEKQWSTGEKCFIYDDCVAFQD